MNTEETAHRIVTHLLVEYGKALGLHVPEEWLRREDNIEEQLELIMAVPRIFANEIFAAMRKTYGDDKTNAAIYNELMKAGERLDAYRSQQN